MLSLRAISVFAVLCVLSQSGVTGKDDFDIFKAVGPCILGRCMEEHVCHRNQCFPKQKNGQEGAIGGCVNGLCPYGYQCSDSGCVKGKLEGSCSGCLCSPLAL
ncbi:hypothetical protein L596_005463 [Steinernema carpocapsae]|uniref:CC domain-containing protein n=1 Tax=Steinernema carpocapsae TaxID=34508 RepID=A0A4V6I8I0_STECR|nr:hypothetical protein L596_005463 [Steinernema carpocapsae]